MIDLQGAMRSCRLCRFLSLRGLTESVMLLWFRPTYVPTLDSQHGLDTMNTTYFAQAISFRGALSRRGNARGHGVSFLLVQTGRRVDQIVAANTTDANKMYDCTIPTVTQLDLTRHSTHSTARARVTSTVSMLANVACAQKFIARDRERKLLETVWVSS